MRAYDIEQADPHPNPYPAVMQLSAEMLIVQHGRVAACREAQVRGHKSTEDPEEQHGARAQDAAAHDPERHAAAPDPAGAAGGPAP